LAELVGAPVGPTVEFSWWVVLGAGVGALEGSAVGPTVELAGAEAAHAKVRIQAERRSTARSLILQGSGTRRVSPH